MADIRKQIRDAGEELFGSSFQFRQFQEEAILGIVESTLNNVKHTLMEAPTGSGKSITAIVAAYVLWKHYAKTTYILVSDLSLFDQYDQDLRRLNSGFFGSIKGKENYMCGANQCPASQSECALAGVSPGSLAHGANLDEFPCAKDCVYIRDYKKAMESPITLMTYQLYFIQRNYVEDSLFGGKNKNFPARDLVVCDECHNICSICQNHFAPTISVSRPKWMETLDTYAHIQPNEMQRINIIQNVSRANSNEDLMKHVYAYQQYLSRYSSLNESIRSKFSGGKKPGKKDRQALSAGNRARQEHCKFTDMFDFISISNNMDYIVRTTSEDTITLNFVYDNLMLKKYFHDKSNCELLMSATIGDFNQFAKLAGLKEDSTNIMPIPSTFDFSKSPIFYQTSNKMSYAEKRYSIQAICNQIVDICHSNENSRGLIQTGNYENSKYLQTHLPIDVLSRCMFYQGSGEKSTSLDAFKRFARNPNDNHILVGPTLIEGLNFPNDECRFQICMKVPYAHLGNEYVKKKKDLVDGWYVYDAVTKICQGIGRGIRHRSDWCETYVLDGCIENIVRRLMKIPVLEGRFKKMSN